MEKLRWLSSSAAGSFFRIEHREAGDATGYQHLILQHIPMFDKFATLDPEDINHNLGRVRPTPDTAVDGDQVALGDDQARLVVDGR